MTDLSNFKSGMMKPMWSGSSRRHIRCACGNNFEGNRYYGDNVCDKCGNRFFKEVNVFASKRTLLDSHFETISKDDKHFHVRKTEVMAHLENNRIVRLEPKLKSQMEMKFDFRTRQLELYRNGQIIRDEEYDRFDTFSKNIHNIEAFVKAISTDKNEELFRFMIKQKGKSYGEKYHRVHKGICYIAQNPWMDTLISIGFSPSTVYNNSGYIRQKETKAHKMLGVSKNILRYLIKFNDISSYKIRDLLKLEEKFNGNTLKEIIQILDEESEARYIFDIRDRLIELYDDYGYTDIKRLVLYSAREVKLQQGIDRPSNALTILRDYARMSQEMQLDYDRYPKSLKKDHDIAQMNYKTKTDEIKARNFALVIEKEDYKKLEFKDKEYAVLIPNEPQDVISEGESLSHCVASYVNDIIKEKCKILFVRPAKEPEKSLLTVEIRDNKFIRQIRGKQNRRATTQEMEFIQKWAEKQELEVSGY